ncbi:hypothetical protein [Streptomyces sp. NPDC093568]|uniref:hypothetical protein n=1 Tax=Streptomyces sp. NPDC093568 TaxID=3366041 RepID=UPI00382866E2
MSKALLCVGDCTPAPRHESEVVAVIAVVIVMLAALSEAEAWRGVVQALLAELVVAVMVAVLQLSPHDRM